MSDYQIHPKDIRSLEGLVLPKVAYNSKNQGSRSNSYYSSRAYKENIKINVKDFWSDQVKSQIFRLQKVKVMRQNPIFRTQDQQSEKLKFPALHEKFQRFQFREVKDMKNNRQTLDKILDKCDVVRKNTRKLSYEMLCSSEVMKDQFKKFQKRWSE